VNGALQISTILISDARLPLQLSGRRLFSRKFSTKQAGTAIAYFPSDSLQLYDFVYTRSLIRGPFDEFDGPRTAGIFAFETWQ